FKAHACCGGTHPSLETLLDFQRTRPFAPDEVEQVELVLAPAAENMCCIPEPRTGLEGKFSVRYASALVLAGRSTGPASFTDEAVKDPQVSSLRERVRVAFDPSIDRGGPGRVTLRLTSGEELTGGIATRDFTDSQLPEQWSVLVDKFLQLTTPVVGQARAEDMVSAVADLEHLTTVTEIVSSVPAAAVA
ncbi:MAG: hypothetical protein ACTHON_12635, partial [Humibacter sp.]